MRMTNLLSKCSRHSSRLACLLAVCGLMYACKDEFILDDEKPAWLKTSIYESLQERGNFKTYLRLLADKDVNPEDLRPLTDVLSRTGSKTVFVANDSSWDAFFAANALLPEENPWHYATCYENLTPAQKKLLIHTSMLNNAIVMENLASSEASESNNNPPVRGEYMRRYTDIEATDSITHICAANKNLSALPFSNNYYWNLDRGDGQQGVEKDYWQRFRPEFGGDGIYMVTDSTLPMMLCFTDEHMSNNSFDNTQINDFKMFMGGRNGRTRKPGDVHIYDALLVQKDGVCENGYINVTEKPLCPLTNMAEVIRTNGKTKIFSHMLDRFSAPFYCERITDRYKTLHPDFNDSIFIKRYFSNNNFSVKGGYVRPNSTTGEIPKFEPAPGGKYQAYKPYTDNAPLKLQQGIAPYLKFDPGWNGYYDEMDVRKDMAAIFVPNDKTMWEFFKTGFGAELISTYYTHKGEGAPTEINPYVAPADGDYDALYKQIDCIPLSDVQAIINNSMQRSFVGSVPSKWGKLVNDAQEPLFDDLALARAKLDTSLVCSNGVIYVINDVCVPADFRSVTGPAYISETNKIIKQAIYGDFMKLNYYAYLKAMQSRFTFLLPSDKALAYYYDPASMKSKTPRALKFISRNNTELPVKLEFYDYYCVYNQSEGTIGTKSDKIMAGTTDNDYTKEEVINRLKDILESHTIVHDGTNPLTHTGEVGQEHWGIDSSTPLDEYYLSKNGNAVKVIRDENDNIIKFKGGFQLENERQGIDPSVAEVGVLDCPIEVDRYMDNGNTYVLKAPLIPTCRSVYSIFTNDADWKEAGTGGITPYSAFYDLCTVENNKDLIVGCGLIDAKLYTDSEKQENMLKKFRIFCDDNGLDLNVQFFNNYRYTIFVPTAEAINNAIADGLPTWDEIRDDFMSHRKPEMEEQDDGTWEIKRDEDGIVYTDSLRTLEDSVRIATKITYLINFIRYHFADNSIFADKTVLAPNEMVTSSYDKKLELFCKIHVDRVASSSGTELRVCDDETWKANGNRMEGVKQPFVTLSEYGGKDVKNILARDISCSDKPFKKQMKGITIESSSAAVIHTIPGYLNHTKLVDGRHDKTWESTLSAKKYLQRYAIR